MKKHTNPDKDSLSEEESSIKKSRYIGSFISIFSIVLFVLYFFQSPNNQYSHLLPYISIFLLLIGKLFILPINYYIFDIKDWEENDEIKGVIKKLRLRAIIFNNLAILILLITIFVIIFSFYQLSHPNLAIQNNQQNETTLNYLLIASQVGSVIVLIFLVQILFRVFKYLLRVGGFYNGKADALELNLLDTEKRYEVANLLESLTPQTYDISDVDSPNLYPKE